MGKILVLDNLSEEGVAVFRQEGFETDVKPAQKPDELAAIIGEYEGLVVRSGTKVTAEALAKADQLRVIGRAGVGTDNIDKAAATERGIVVMNTPGGNTISTCEHTFALMLALCRNVPSAHVSMMEGRWDRKKFMGAELCGKTLGVIGVGRIGGAVAKRALAFEMKVLAFDPLLTPLKADALGVELVSLEDILARSDFISIHAPKSDKTNNMIRMEQLKQMKPECRIVNCARGGIVNEQDLAQALKDGVIAGAGLDVYTSEPLEDNPFIGLTNIVTTPHLAASTDEAQTTVAVEVAQQMANYLKTGEIVNAVNVPSLDKQTRETLAPMLYLADRLGHFLSLWSEGKPSEIDIDYFGELPVTDVYPITASVLTGFLRPLVDSPNMISAPSQLESRGIDVSETRSGQDSDYAFEIAVTLRSEKEEHTVHGTLFQDDDPRIIAIDGTRVDARPVGHMLVCSNEDKPMVLANIASIIGDSGVNIANLTLGRDKPGGSAFTVLNLDAAVAPEILERIAAAEHVTSARLVSLPS